MEDSLEDRIMEAIESMQVRSDRAALEIDILVAKRNSLLEEVDILKLVVVNWKNDMAKA